MQNQTQSVTAVTGQMPGVSADGEVVLLERVFKQRRISARPRAGQHSLSENRLELSNVAFFRKELPVGAVDEPAALCADLMNSYARAAKLCEAHAASYALCVAAHKRSALLSDAHNRLRTINTAASALPERRRVLGAVFEAILGASEDGEDAVSQEFKRRLNTDALPVECRVGLAALFVQINSGLRRAGAIRRSGNEI